MEKTFLVPSFEVGPCIVTQVRTKEVDGYEALQLGFDDKTEKNSTKAQIGHSKKAGSSVKRKVVEFQGFDEEYKLGDSIRLITLLKVNLLMFLELQKVKDFKVL